MEWLHLAIPFLAGLPLRSSPVHSMAQTSLLGRRSSDRQDRQQLHWRGGSDHSVDPERQYAPSSLIQHVEKHRLGFLVAPLFLKETPGGIEIFIMLPSVC